LYKISDKLKNKIDNLPLLPGCYIYKNLAGEIIYIGKAVKLRNRVKSYFTNYERVDSKTQVLVKNISDLEFLVVDSEAEALILETNLIKKYHPKFNRLMTDDKNYSWIKINLKEEFPRIKLVREKLNDQARYFGPYPSTFPAKDVLKRLRKIFPYRSCDRKMVQLNGKVKCQDSKPCLYYHLGLCQAPCANKILKNEYRKSILGISKFLAGDKSKIVIELENQMKMYSKNMDFENAALIRDRLQNIKYVLTKVHIGEQLDDVYILNKKEIDRQNSIRELFEILRIWKEEYSNKSIKIECYDISNISGTNAVGAMVVVKDGVPENSLYRKFKIKSKQTPDDFSMHQEMMARRLKNYINKSDDLSFKDLPELMIIDGGKGQLTSVYEIIKSFNLESKINVCALAKKEEEIFILDQEKGGFIKIRLGKRHEALKLMQRIRDESHRFGIKYHRKLRSQQMLKS